MDAKRWERVQELFHAAIELPEDERDAWLTATCGSDTELRERVQALVAEDARSDSLLDRNLANVASEILNDRAPDLPRERFGPYRISRILGEGGMGVVYLGERDDLSAVAAIKILRDAWLSPARRERFTAEQRTLAQLTHPSIARLYHADSLPDGTPWFAMEYVEGVPLTTYCRERNLDVRERLRLFRVVCEAVQYAHQHLIVHRDLKPSNILVRHDGSVVLLDFGIAKQIEEGERRADATRTGMRFMTPAYAAPEQLRGEHTGIHTDVYSLGVVLYEVLTGQLPHDVSDKTPAEAELVVLQATPERPSLAAKRNHAGAPLTRDSSWQDLDVLCLTAMHKDGERRYRTADALIRDIDHFLRGEPLEARPDSFGYRAGKFVRRNTGRLAIAGAVLALVIGLTAFYTVRLASARDAALQEAARTQRIQRFLSNLFEGGDEAAGPSESLRVITLVDRGRHEAASLSTEPAVQAELYATLGGIYRELGNLERADTLLGLSLSQRRRVLGPEHADVVRSLGDIALLRAAQARLDDAEASARQAVTLARKIFPPDHPDLAIALSTLGLVLENKGSYQESITVLQEAAAIQRARSAESPELNETMTELANSNFYLGNYQVADSLNHVLLAMSRSLFGPRHPHVADDLINIGAVQNELGNQVEAQKYYREALGIIRGWYGDDHPETASAESMLARQAIFLGRFGEADTLLHDALRIEERVYGPVHPRVASTVNEVARLAQQRGQIDAAVAGFTRMLSIYRSIYGDGHYYVGVALGNLAGALVEKHEYDRAVQLLHTALAVYAKTLPADHQYVAIAHIKLARAYAAAGRFALAEQEGVAGYDLLHGKANTSAAWLESARKVLAQVYDSLGQPDKAKRYRDELAAKPATP
ncbi:MAG: serine/threonine-protein kinase [Gemmatimonadaceae bacterium]